MSSQTVIVLERGLPASAVVQSWRCSLTALASSRASLAPTDLDSVFSLAISNMLQRLTVPHFLVFLAQGPQFLLVQVVEAQQRVLCILGHPQQLIDLDMQHIVVAVLRVLNQENHQEGDDGGGCIDDQLPGVVVMKVGPRQRPHEDQYDGNGKSPGTACPLGQSLDRKSVV